MRSCLCLCYAGRLAAVQVERLKVVRVYSTAFLVVGRVVFEVAPEYCTKYGRYADGLRIWGVTLTGGPYLHVEVGLVGCVCVGGGLGGWGVCVLWTHSATAKFDPMCT